MIAFSQGNRASDCPSWGLSLPRLVSDTAVGRKDEGLLEPPGTAEREAKGFHEDGHRGSTPGFINLPTF